MGAGLWDRLCSGEFHTEGAGGAGWGGPTRGRLSKVGFPSAKFGVKLFSRGGWVSEPKDTPPPDPRTSKDLKADRHQGPGGLQLQVSL